MVKRLHQRALDILVHRCAEWSRVTLRDGRTCMVFDVAWGYDLGDGVAHLTTNCSPGPRADAHVDHSYAIDHFRADEIRTIEDHATGAVLFDLEAAS